MPFDICAQRRFRLACAFAHFNQNLHCAHFDSQGRKVSSCGQRLSVCMDAQVDLCLLWAVMPDGTVSHVRCGSYESRLFGVYANREGPVHSVQCTITQCDHDFYCPHTELLKCPGETTRTQQIHNVAVTSLQCRCNVTTLQRRYNDIVATLCVCWGCVG